ncbi:MAG: DUF6164 family protein [Gammaproteobacteria bacterium]
MAIHLMSLRNVPADELEEIQALLEANGIEVYETTVGSFGISMPALWLYNDTQLAQARALLDTYAEERRQRVQREHPELKAAGKARTFRDIAREDPVRFVVYLAAIGAVAWFALVPFLSFAV